MKSCFLIGHRDSDPELQPLLNRAVEHHVTQYGVTEFYVGNHGRFDNMAAVAIREAKKLHPGIRFTLVLAYHPAGRPPQIPAGCDSTFYPWEDEHVPERFAIVRTNQRMVDRCQYVIANAWHHMGGAGQIVEYARLREKRGLVHVQNLAAAFHTLPDSLASDRSAAIVSLENCDVFFYDESRIDSETGDGHECNGK